MASSTRTLVIAGTLAIAVASGLAVASGPAQADTLLVDSVAAARPTTAERPLPGNTMTGVEARFGAPASRSGPVGKPPITRWDYADFVVYFEFDHVVHSVRR
jgi:hypothetical protein